MSSPLDRIRDRARFAAIVREEKYREQAADIRARARLDFLTHVARKAQYVLGPVTARSLMWEYDPAPPFEIEAADAWLDPDTRLRYERNHDTGKGWFGLVEADGTRTEVREIADLAGPLTDGGAG